MPIPLLTFPDFMTHLAPAREHAAGLRTGAWCVRIEEAHPRPAQGLPPTRADYYALVAIAEGAGTYTCDGTAHALTDRTVYLSTPGHVKSFESPRVNRGFVVAFSAAWLTTHFGAEAFRRVPALAEGCPPPVRLDEAAFAEVALRCEGMRRAQATLLHDRGDAAAGDVSDWLRLVVGAVGRHLGAADGPRSGDSATVRLLAALDAALRALVTGERRHRPTVSELAAELHYSADALGKAVRKESGRAPQTWLNARLAAAANAQLVHTRAPISGIAAALGFSDGSQFARFVRRELGRSPSEVRG